MKPKKPRLTAMTKKKHDELVAGGCDPHCHACKVKINVGDKWAMKVFIEGHHLGNPMLTDIFGTLNIKGSCCAECVATNRGLPSEEIADFDARMSAWYEKISYVNAGPKPPTTPKAPRPGCFVLPDGTRI